VTSGFEGIDRKPSHPRISRGYIYFLDVYPEASPPTWSGGELWVCDYKDIIGE